MEQFCLSLETLIDQAMHIVEHDNPKNALEVLARAKAILKEEPRQTEDTTGMDDEEDTGEDGEMVLHEEMMDLQEDVAAEARTRDEDDGGALQAPRQV